MALSVFVPTIAATTNVAADSVTAAMLVTTVWMVSCQETPVLLDTSYHASTVSS